MSASSPQIQKPEVAWVLWMERPHGPQGLTSKSCFQERSLGWNVSGGILAEPACSARGPSSRGPPTWDPPWLASLRGCGKG